MKISRISQKNFVASISLLVIFFTNDVIAQNSYSGKYLLKIESSDTAEIIVEDDVIRQAVPSTLFGFNINFLHFQKQLWDKNTQTPREGIIDYLKPFKNAIYRYPGGLVANTFHWTGAVGELNERIPQVSFFDKKSKQVYFGIDEYFDFVKAVGGYPWYVLNLVGLDPQKPMLVADADEVARNNLALARYLNDRIDSTIFPLYLELGNELDRSKYEWTPQEYVDRSLSTVEAISAEIESVKFIPALRDFKMRYKKKSSTGRGNPEEFITAAVNGLNMVDGYSVHHYYDGKREDGKSRSIPFWLRLMTRSIETYKSIRKEAPKVWITEHGRQPNSNKPGRDGTKNSTSNLSAAISSADYLIALSLIPEIQGAVWHGLNAHPWQLFDYSVRYNDLRPRPIYWSFRVMAQMNLGVGLATRTKSPNLSNYDGGYDIRASAFRNDDADQLGVRVMNRHSDYQSVKINYKEFENKDVEIKHYYISAAVGADPENEDRGYNLELEPGIKKYSFSSSGELELEIPPSSVSTLIIKII